MSQFPESEKLRSKQEEFELLMQFASYIYDGHPFLQNVEDGSSAKEEELEEAVHSFLGLDVEKLKQERERMEGMLRHPNKKVI